MAAAEGLVVARLPRMRTEPHRNRPTRQGCRRAPNVPSVVNRMETADSRQIGLTTAMPARVGRSMGGEWCFTASYTSFLMAAKNIRSGLLNPSHAEHSME